MQCCGTAEDVENASNAAHIAPNVNGTTRALGADDCDVYAAAEGLERQHAPAAADTLSTVVRNNPVRSPV